MRLRVLAWNVHGFRTGWRRPAEALAGSPPDVAMLQEVGRTGWRLRRFARRLGMRSASGLRVWGRGIPNAVLVRPPWRLVYEGAVRLTRHHGLPRRGLLLAVVGRAGHRLTAVSVHLGLSDAERVAHAREIADRIPSLRQPVLLGGDLNEQPEGAAATWMGERLWDAFVSAGEGPGETYPAEDPTGRIDYLFVSDGLRVERAWVLATAASDHLPVFADVELGSGPDE